ncbi:ferredoxin [Nocardia carnea]|uniref:ferredoxin n=1 Tax=Nocardia carnea TaxID=37328 RepID=UPI002457734E|nr:ferredoxin [Nocardia carnea]
MTTGRADNRLLDTPMQPLRCRACAAELLVRKSSWHQTSVQWNAEALSTCRELGAAPMPGPSLAGCSQLRETIRGAAASGALHVVERPPA